MIRNFTRAYGAAHGASQPRRLPAPVRLVLLAGFLVAAFFSGKLLGHLHFGTGSAASVATASSAAVGQDRSTQDVQVAVDRRADHAHPVVSMGTGAGHADGAASHGKLRLRPLSGIRTDQVREGSRISFLTTEDFADASGRKVPAGSRVEGVITPRAATVDHAADWVIEIHSLHVGNQALMLRALPLAALQPAGRGESLPRLRSPRRDGSLPRQSDPWNPLQQIPHLAVTPEKQQSQGLPPADAASAGTLPAPRPDPVEAGDLVVPSSTVLEFQLLGLPGLGGDVRPLEMQQPRDGEAPAAPPVFREPETRPASPRPFTPMPRPRSARA